MAIGNTPARIAELARRLSKIGIEATGGYERPLADPGVTKIWWHYSAARVSALPA